MNSVLFYSDKIFSSNEAGNDEGAKIGTALVGVCYVVATFLSMWLLKYFGRKALLIAGQIGMAACLGAIGLFFELGNSLWIKVFTLADVTVFSLSMGPIMWLYLAEIMTESGMSVAMFLNWLVVLAISLATPTMIDHWPGPSSTFWMYAVLCVLGLLVVCLCVRETKGKTDREIRALFRSNSSRREKLKTRIGTVKTEADH